MPYISPITIMPDDKARLDRLRARARRARISISKGRGSKRDSYMLLDTRWGLPLCGDGHSMSLDQVERMIQVAERLSGIS